jgi:hypothetical protein
VLKGELSQKGMFGRWPSFFFELAADGGDITLASFKKEGGKMKDLWTVAGVEGCPRRPWGCATGRGGDVGASLYYTRVERDRCLVALAHARWPVNPIRSLLKKNKTNLVKTHV